MSPASAALDVEQALIVGGKLAAAPEVTRTMLPPCPLIFIIGTACWTSWSAPKKSMSMMCFHWAMSAETVTVQSPSWCAFCTTTSSRP